MKSRIHLSFFRVFIILSGAFCLLYVMTFNPVTYEAQGDFPSYLELAKQIYHLPGAGETDLSHRSPLYSLVLGLFILLFGESHYLHHLMIFHFTLIFLTSILIYKIFNLITGNRIISFIAGIAGVLNLTTIFFGYIMISEILSLFLFTLMGLLLIQGYLREKTLFFSLAGVTAGLLILTRFNTIGIPVVIISGCAIFHFIRYGFTRIRKLLAEMLVFTIAFLLVINIWSFYNYRDNGIYGLMPKHHTGQRWAIPATISSDDIVSDEYNDVLAIFLKTKEELLSKVNNIPARKGSLLTHKGIRKINDFFRPQVSGYFIYRDSEAELMKYYGLEYSPVNIRILNEKLKPFYKLIAEQNRKELNRFRIYSFIYSFKHVSPTLPVDNPVSLNVLPSAVLKLYKLLFIFMTLTTYSISIIHGLHIFSSKGRIKAGIYWIILYSLIWYFPVANWYANVLSDANRFRFPADSVIIGIFVWYCAYLVNLVNQVKSRGNSEKVELGHR